MSQKIQSLVDHVDNFLGDSRSRVKRREVLTIVFDSIFENFKKEFFKSKLKRNMSTLFWFVAGLLAGANIALSILLFK